jgi:hypothetical protein
MSAQASIPDVVARAGESYPIKMLSTGWIGERLHADAADWMSVAEGPTVTATALHLLHGLAPEGRICLVGMDLTSRGLLNHARPHPNDRLIATWAHRLRPESSIRAERILGPSVTTELWQDGVLGYRSPALQAFRPEIDRILALHRTTGSVISLGGDMGDPESVNSRDTTPSENPDSGRPAESALQSVAPVRRAHPRPPRTDRIDHVRRTLRTWRSAAVGGDWDVDQREILFHLAPVAVLRALRGDVDSDAVATAARATLDGLETVLERISLQ